VVDLSTELLYLDHGTALTRLVPVAALIAVYDVDCVGLDPVEIRICSFANRANIDDWNGVFTGSPWGLLGTSKLRYWLLNWN
jgi:hypothetical protein